MSTITTKFIKAFDSQNMSHVKWLSHMIDLAESMNDPTAHITLVAEINMNPMKIELDQRDALDWPHIHFCLCAVYAKAVLRGLAFVPI
jgi:hypothetical protein